jgi:predicted phosphodiesterase
MTRRPFTVLHVSDLQCGRPFLPAAAEAMLRLAHRVGPDAVVVSGDLTQRAKRSEFAQARALLDRLGDVPTVMTPGNHDVPVYRFWERTWAPHGNWIRFADHGRDTVTRLNGATFVALDSTAPYRAIVSGHVTKAQLDLARHGFADSPAEDLRIVVVHHHFVPLPDGAGGDALGDAGRILAAFDEMGVDAVLGGHVHQIHLATSHDVPTAPELRARRAIPLVACGTTTSSRGRGVEAGWNSLCVERFGETTLVVEPYRRRPEGRDFEPMTPVEFPLRARSAAPAGPAAGQADGRLSAAGKAAD